MSNFNFVLPQKAWGRVGRSALDRSMSLQARGLYAWLAIRPRGWGLDVEKVQKELGIGRAAWVRARRELEQHGLLKTAKKPAKNGQWIWTFELKNGEK